MTFIEKTVDYFRSAKAEMFKVSWPSRRDTVRYSALIIGVSAVVGLFFMALDFGFTNYFEGAIIKFAKTQAPAAATAPADTQPVDVTTAPTASGTPGTVDLNNAKPIETPKNK